MESTSRRSFMGVAAAGAAAFTATGAAAAQQPKNPSTDLIRVGVACLGDNSHMNYSIWAPMLNPTEPDRWPVGRTTRMQITHCWDREFDRAQAFAKQYGCEAVKNYDGMVGKVDGMIFAGFNEVAWWPQLSKPYLEAGIPCFLNRPFAYSMKDAEEIVNNARRHNTPILCTDEREYIQQAIVARKKVEDLVRSRRTILGGHSSNASGEWSQHGVHGLYFLLAVFGLDVEKVGYQADGWWKETTPTATLQHWGQLTMQYRGITLEDGAHQENPFVVAQLETWPRADITLRVYHSEGWWDIAHEHTEGDGGFNRHFYLFFPTMLAVQRMFETRQMQWSYDYILKKTKIFLAAFKSHLEHNGALIDVDSLPYDWKAPSPYADWLNESMFS